MAGSPHFAQISDDEFHIVIGNITGGKEVLNLLDTEKIIPLDQRIDCSCKCRLRLTMHSAWIMLGEMLARGDAMTWNRGRLVFYLCVEGG